jgi:hypothetical protein
MYFSVCDGKYTSSSTGATTLVGGLVLMENAAKPYYPEIYHLMTIGR